MFRTSQQSYLATCSPHPPTPVLPWVVDFVGPIKHATCYAHNCYILILTEYITKHVEAKALRSNTDTITGKLYMMPWLRDSDAH